MQWQPIIGLEVHVQLKTRSKLFSGSSARFNALPNTQVGIIDLAYPGALPGLNEAAVKMAVKFGLSINAEIIETSVFERKNYFYPDLPKGYQITQHEFPLIKNGFINIHLSENETRQITIDRAHLEEDAGKSLHDNFSGFTRVDFNRVGVPLLEIVSAPEIYSAKEAVIYLQTLQTLVRYLGISDANMQEGSFRCDVNVSVKSQEQNNFGVRTEIKNLNSFRFVEHAIDYEISRQIKLLESGHEIIQETRLYDETANETRPMRFKEEAEDYHYFPDPDLLPLKLTKNFIQQIKKDIPELPEEKLQRLQKNYNLSFYEANILVSDFNVANYFEEVVAIAKVAPKLAVNWVIGELAAALNSNKLTITQSPVTARQLGGLLNRIEDNTISGKIAKEIFVALWNKEGEVDEIIVTKGLQQITDVKILSAIIDEVINFYPKQLKEYQTGKESLLDFFVGKIMAKTKGRANPEQLHKLLKEQLRR